MASSRTPPCLHMHTGKKTKKHITLLLHATLYKRRGFRAEFPPSESSVTVRFAFLFLRKGSAKLISGDPLSFTPNDELMSFPPQVTLLLGIFNYTIRCVRNEWKK